MAYLVIARITERLWRLELQLLDSIFPPSLGDQRYAQISILSWAQDLLHGVRMELGTSSRVWWLASNLSIEEALGP